MNSGPPLPRQGAQILEHEYLVPLRLWEPRAKMATARSLDETAQFGNMLQEAATLGDFIKRPLSVR